MEHFFTCPYCWQTISFVLDPDEEQGCYVEDCKVCCRPIEVTVRFDEVGEVVRFESRRIEGT